MEIPHPNTEKYLKNLLNPSDKIAFENLMKEHPQLAEDVSNEKLAMEAIDLLIANELRTTLENTPREETKVVPLRKSNFRKWSIAASFLILIAAASYVFTSQQNLDSEQFALNNIVLVEEEITTRGEPSSVDIHPTREEFVKAQLLFQQGKYDDALMMYRSVYNSTDMSPEDKDIADWNVIMCLLKLKNIPEAKSLLEALIKDENHYYFDKSSNLLDKL